MRSALKWTLGLLFADLVILGAGYLALSIAASVGADIEPLKWPTVFFGGLLLLFAGILAASLLCMMIALLFDRHARAR